MDGEKNEAIIKYVLALRSARFNKTEINDNKKCRQMDYRLSTYKKFKAFFIGFMIEFPFSNFNPRE